MLAASVVALLFALGCVVLGTYALDERARRHRALAQLCRVEHQLRDLQTSGVARSPRATDHAPVREPVEAGTYFTGEA